MKDSILLIVFDPEEPYTKTQKELKEFYPRIRFYEKRLLTKTQKELKGIVKVAVNFNYIVIG